jgi:GntR family histidine utilization transcriptional repressor
MSIKPLHERIRSEIEDQILSGAARPGDRIPSELELMVRYGCSRMTVSKALSALNAAGLVQRRKRAGTVVAERRTESLVLDVPDLPVEIARRGQTYRFQLISKEIRPPSKADTEEERLAGEGELLSVTGVHHADASPFAYEERLVSLSAVPEIAAQDFSYDPPGSWLLRHIPWTEAEHRIGATAASDNWAQLLHVAAGAPCLTVERRTWRAHEEVTLVRQHFVASQYQLVARFGATARQRPA